MADNTTGCTVVTDTYRLVVDVTQPPMVRMLAPDGKAELAHVGSVSLGQDGRRYTAAASPAPHFHPLRSGPYLVELHIENIILCGVTDWPGLAEISLYCHEDRVYMVAAFLCQEKEWVNRGMYVYRAAEGHRACPAVAPVDCGFELTGLARSRRMLALRQTAPAGQAGPVVSEGTAVFSCRPTDTPWQPGSVHEVGGMIAVASSESEARAVLEDEGAPLPAGAFAMTMGQSAGYDPTRGVYSLTAQTSGTPEPPVGLRAGTRYTVSNDGRARTILVDQRDPWGGISGGVLRDGAGEPLPVVIQFGLNYPEMWREAGEPGWATLTYPLSLRPNERREVRGEHLYHALSDREVMYLNSLDNIGDPLLLQTTVGRGEAHTLTTGPYPGKLTPGNELRINDFRRIYSREKVRSVSAILPTFFGYWDAKGDYQGLRPGFVTMRETSPFLAEYTIDAATPDGAVNGNLRVWQAPHDDMVRVFTEVSLRVNRTVRLDAQRAAPLFFLRHHAFNPMAFMRFAYTQPDGSAHDGGLSYARTVVVNGAPMGEAAFGCLYRASNAIDNGIPCSDITGNPGFVLLEWDVRFADRKIKPGCYAFCTGAGDTPDGDYARDLAVVPTQTITEIPAGSLIHYRAVQVVCGDNSSDYGDMERERTRWALKPLRATARIGSVLSADPPEFRAAGRRIEAEVTGGANWIPIRVRGMTPGERLHVRQADAMGDRELGPGAPEEPWYSAWPDAKGTCGFTFLVKMPESGGAVRLEVWQ
jgi:hypothetical protein